MPKYIISLAFGLIAIIAGVTLSFYHILPIWACILTGLAIFALGLWLDDGFGYYNL